MEFSLAYAQEQDQKDTLKSFRERFHFPQHNGRDTVYFTGNSLGLAPKTAMAALEQEVNDWAKYGVEGHFEANQSVVLIEDLISSGKSSLEAVSTLREAGMNVKGIVSIFTYGFEKAKENFEDANCEYISLCDFENLLLQALKTSYITKAELPLLQEWRKDPSKWNK